MVGVTTAYELHRRGHDVTVVDAELSTGQGATAGNAGILTQGDSTVWATPAAPRMLLGALAGRDPHVKVRLNAGPSLVHWGVRFLRECTTSRQHINTAATFRLSRYSIEATNDIAATEGIEFKRVTGGGMLLFRSDHALKDGLRERSILQANGHQFEVLRRDEVIDREPALAAARDLIAGALYSSVDGSGDAEAFTVELAERCRASGVEFALGTRVLGLRAEGKRVVEALTDRGSVSADCYVVSLGAASTRVARTVGDFLPVCPVRGFSITAPILNGEAAPLLPAVDEHHRVAYSRMGDRLRLSSSAVFSNFDDGFTDADFASIFTVARELFPDAADWPNSVRRARLRPLSSTGRPIIGRGGPSNVLYNTGHGPLGWTQAAGSARLLAGLLSGEKTELDIRDYQLGRPSRRRDSETRRDRAPRTRAVTTRRDL